MKGRFLKLGVAALTFCFLLVFIDFALVAKAMALVSLFDIVLLGALSIVLIGVSVVKWSAFLSHLGVRASFWSLFGLYLVGYFVNLLMPSYVGGDVVRALSVNRGSDKEASFSATLLERYTGLAAMLLLGLVGVCIAPSVTVEIRVVALLVCVGFLGVSAALFGGWTSRLVGLVSRIDRLKKYVTIASAVERIERGIRSGIGRPKLVVKAMLLSLLFHSLTVVNTVAVAHAVGWESPPILDLFVVLPLILLIGALPISPQGLGIQEGAFVFFLNAIGAPPGEALAIALVLRAKSYVLALFGGVVWWGRGRHGLKLRRETD